MGHYDEDYAYEEEKRDKHRIESHKEEIEKIIKGIKSSDDSEFILKILKNRKHLRAVFELIKDA